MPPPGSQGPQPGPGAWSDLDRPPLRVGPLRRALLRPAGPLARLDVVARTASTNADLVAAAQAPDSSTAWPDLSALVADHQQAGRGRAGRGWQTPARAAVTASLLLRPEVPPAAWSWLPLLVGLGVVRAVRDVAGLPAGLKWPNDVLVPAETGGPQVHGARKLAGVLAEVSGTAAVVGVGLNVTQTRAELPVPTATSLRLAGAATTDRDTVLRAVVRSVAEQYSRWCSAGGDAGACGLADAVRESCLSLGRPVRVELPGGGTLVGDAEGIDDQGRLVVRSADGAVAVVAAGDVEHLRDAS